MTVRATLVNNDRSASGSVSGVFADTLAVGVCFRGQPNLTTTPPTFAISLAAADERSVRVEVRGELDLSTSPELGDALRHELDGGRSVIVDLSQVTFIDSTALNTLIAALRSCESNGCSLAVSPTLPPQVTKVFKITGLDSVIPLARS